MSVEKLEQQIAKQNERLQQLKAQKMAILSREKKQQKEQSRKDEMRRKILIGACMLNLTKDDAIAHEKLLARLDVYLTEDRDRVLFGFKNKCL